MALKATLWAGLLVCTGLMAGAADEPFRAMVVALPQEAGEGGMFDYPLTKAGYEFKRYNAEDPGAIMADLDQYDVMMVAILVNLNKTFADKTTEIRKWVEAGHALVIIDACDASLYNPFLSSVLPGSPVTTKGCVGWENLVKYGFVRDTAPTHPMRCFPERLDFECRQWHCLAASGNWETVATCSGPGDIHPVTVCQPLGKGVVYVSSMQQRWKALPINLRAFLRFVREGLEVRSYELTPFEAGPGSLKMRIKCLGEKPEPVEARLEFVPESGSPVKVVRTFRPQDGVIDVDLPFKTAFHGPVKVSLSFVTPTATIPVFAKQVGFPPVLEILLPRYRGVLAAERRIGKVGFEIRSAPETGRRAGGRITLTVEDGHGHVVGRNRAELPTNFPSAFTFRVALPALKPGSNYVAKAELEVRGGRTGKATTNFTVRAGGAHPGEVVVDEDNTLLVDGKPFFPLVIYHLPPEDFPAAADIGFNVMQTFQWFTRKRESLDAAQAVGAKIFFENNEKEAGGHGYLPGFLRDHPAMLMWYLPDEPLHEVNFDFTKTISGIYRTGDPFHPTVAVDFNAPRFAENQQAADILTCEAYLVKKGQPPDAQPYLRAADAMDAAWDAVKRRKPVFMDHGCFGVETETDQRVTAWLALTHDARGLMWYAWRENDTVGLKYNDTLRAAMKGLLADIKTLTPALTAPVRRPFVRNKQVHAIVCSDGSAVTLLAVNPTREMAAMPPVEEVPEFGGQTPEPLLGGPAYTEPLKPFETRAYRVSASHRQK